MTISSALNAGVAGLAANSARLSSISDNIANSSTYGYKRADTDFTSLVIDTGGGGYSAGGVRVTTQRLIDERGALVASNNSTDLAVRGRGFLPVTSTAIIELGATAEPPLYLATTGSFRTNENGLLVTESGLTLLGVPANSDGSIPIFSRDTKNALVPVEINANQFAGEPTTQMSVGVNLPATETDAGAAGTALPLSIEYFDNLGTSESLTFTFTPTIPGTGSSNEWTLDIVDSDLGVSVGNYTILFDDTRTAGGTINTVTTNSGGVYDATTGIMQVTVGSGPIDIDIGIPGNPQGITQLSDSFAPTSITKDGSPVGNLTEINVDANGLVTAAFDIGITRTLYQIPLVDVPNANGLTALDNQTYAPSFESGSFFLWDAADGPTGDIVSFAREESTTDVAGELTELIQTQRAYSSNAKVIQTVDEMLQETTNIKR
ncbi:MAG: flagellar hook-basal body complex protein [Pseudomonadota bacterium]